MKQGWDPWRVLLIFALVQGLILVGEYFFFCLWLIRQLTKTG
jgi:hypothetical protein